MAFVTFYEKSLLHNSSAVRMPDVAARPTLYLGRWFAQSDTSLEWVCDALFTVLGDSAWVLASVRLLILPIFHFTTDAKWAIGITAICVDIFTTIQFLEWRKQR